jgi:cyclic pyranopterin phosphate synthase
MRWTHLDEHGRARMVSVAEKETSLRRATAEGEVGFGERSFGLLRDARLGKGDALAVARIAGIQAAKRTADWIPLCHPVPLDHVELDFSLDERRRVVRIRARAVARWTTGVEMEALTAVAAAGLVLYDMAKGVDRGVEIRNVRLVEKSGGRSGTWVRGGPEGEQL